MNSQQIFVSLIDEIFAKLDSIGLYVIESDMNIIGSTVPYNSYDELRDHIKDSKAMGFMDLECFIGKSAWREDPKELFMDMAEIEITDISEYFKDRLGE